MRRRKVPNVIRRRSKVSDYNIRNDKMGDIKKHYGWSEQRLEKEVRAGAEKAPPTEIKARYAEAYNTDKCK